MNFMAQRGTRKEADGRSRKQGQTADWRCDHGKTHQRGKDAKMSFSESSIDASEQEAGY